MPLDLYTHPNGILYVRGTVTVWRGGEPHPVAVHRSTRTRDPRQAEAIRRQIENEVAERNITGREPALTFAQAAARYLAQGGEARFLARPRAHLGAMRIDAITQADLDDAAVKAYPANADTRRRQFYTPVIAVLTANGVNTRFRRPKAGGVRTVFFRPDQADAALKAMLDVRFPNPWAPALATFLFGQGSRVGETLALDGRDVSLEHRYAVLRETKNGNERMVTLVPRVVAALSTLPNVGRKGPLFLRYDGRPYQPRKNRGYRLRFWETAVEAVGLDPETYTPHTARHSWATWFYGQTRDVVRLKAEGGWQSGEWQRYVKLAAPSLGQAALGLGFDFRQNGPETDYADFPRERAVS